MITDEETIKLINQEELEEWRKNVCERFILTELTEKQIQLAEERTGNKYDKKTKSFIRRKNNG